jgi:hypothetical protein
MAWDPHQMQGMVFLMAADLIHPMDQMAQEFKEMEMVNQHLTQVMEYLTVRVGNNTR